MAKFYVPVSKFRPPPTDPLDLCGEDVALRNGYEIANGDWKTVRGSLAAILRRCENACRPAG